MFAVNKQRAIRLPTDTWLPYKSSYGDTATALVNQIFLAVGWKNTVTRREVCLPLLCSHPLLRALSSLISCKPVILKCKEEQKLSKGGGGSFINQLAILGVG